MFERFTERARRVVCLAQEQAEMLNRDYIGTEHLLLGLIGAGDGVAETALVPQRISTGVVRQGVVLHAAQRAGTGGGADPGPVEEIAGQRQLQPPVHLPFTERAREALELATQEADVLGLDVGSEHILLGLIRVDDGEAAQALVQSRVDLNRVRQQVLQQLLGAAFARVDSLDRRLAAVEGFVGMALDLRGIDQEIAQVLLAKEAAIVSMEFEVADALRDKERRLLDARTRWEKEWTKPAAGRVSLAGEIVRVNAELKRLQAILREHGIEPDGDPS